MKRLVVVLSVVALAACQVIREEMPTTPEVLPTAGPAAPIVVTPVQIPTPAPGGPAPAPTSAPAPTPRPGGTPRPTPTPSGGGGGGGGTGSVAQVTAGVHSYLHNGQLVPRSASVFTAGDVIYLNCTPRDGAGQPVDRHGPLQGWWVTGSARFTVTNTDSFNPDCHTQGPGYIDIQCQVDNVTSPVKRLTIQP
jgi:hypothetical protein